MLVGSHSIVGSTMGTPSYMPPEQADPMPQSASDFAPTVRWPNSKEPWYRGDMTHCILTGVLIQ